MKREMTLSAYINEKLENSYYYFSSKEYLACNNISPQAFHNSASRLAKKKHILRIAKDFYIIIPPEYRHRGIIPTTWFVDDLMKHLGVQYYVGLLTATSLMGFAHQQPQQFQIMVNRRLNLSSVKMSAHCVLKHDIHSTLYQKEKCDTGYFNIARKEALALDLVQYIHLCGYLNNVGTILYEIGGDLDHVVLATVAKRYPRAVIQRLGYLLEFVKHNDKADELYGLLQYKKVNYVKLSPKRSDEGKDKNKKWHIIINHEVDIDL